MEERLHIRLDAETKEMLEELAEKEQRSMSDVLRLQIREGHKHINAKQVVISSMIVRFLESLPSSVSIVAWDVITNKITEATRIVADRSEHYEEYDLLKAVVGASDVTSPGLRDYCMMLIEEMLEDKGEIDNPLYELMSKSIQRSTT